MSEFLRTTDSEFDSIEDHKYDPNSRIRLSVQYNQQMSEQSGLQAPVDSLIDTTGSEVVLEPESE